MKDFLGNSYVVGDYVVWPSMSGRSVTMSYGVVDRFSWGEDGAGQLKVYVQPVKDARWKNHSGRTYYVDTRTGKRIDPTRTNKHTEVPQHWVYADGTKFEGELDSNGYPMGYSGIRPRYQCNFGKLGEVNPFYDDKEKSRIQLWYVRNKYFDYVETRTEGPKPVTIYNTENIIKVSPPVE